VTDCNWRVADSLSGDGIYATALFLMATRSGQRRPPIVLRVTAICAFET
jgi:hypothetical protein